MKNFFQLQGPKNKENACKGSVREPRIPLSILVHDLLDIEMEIQCHCQK